MNHPQGRIFTPTRNQPLTGRNANIQPTMFKKKHFFEKNATERHQTPFSGYSFTGSSLSDINSLGQSQVSQFSQDAVRRLIKEEFEKSGVNNFSENSQESARTKNQINCLRIEIRGIKESFHNINRSFKAKIDDQNERLQIFSKELKAKNRQDEDHKEEIANLVGDKIKDMEEDIAKKMRLIFGKMQEDLRKELTNYANRQFLSVNFLDDLDKQLNQLDDRIAFLEQKQPVDLIQSGKSQMITGSKIEKEAALSSGSELKLNKLERDLQFLRKLVDEKSEKIKELDELIVMEHEKEQREVREIKQNILELSNSFKDYKKNNEQRQQEYENSINRSKEEINGNLQRQLGELKKRVNQLSQNNQESRIQRLLNSTAQEEKETVIQKRQTSALTDDSTKFSDNGAVNKQQKQVQPQNCSNQSNDSLLRKQQKKITITYGSTQKTANQEASLVNYENVEVSPHKNQFSPQKDFSNHQLNEQKNTQIDSQVMYKIDKEGYLMDLESKYILSCNDSMIKVPESQIEKLQKSGLISISAFQQEE